MIVGITAVLVSEYERRALLPISLQGKLTRIQILNTPSFDPRVKRYNDEQ